MKKKILNLLALLVFAISANAQTTIWSESFDSSATASYAVTLGGEGSKYNTTYNTTSDYFFRTSGTYFYLGSGVAQAYYGATGDFFAAQDIDDGAWTGSANPSQLTWTGISIAGYSGITFESMFASVNDAKIDDQDSVLVEYRIDGGNWVSLLAFRNDGSTYNTSFMEDTNLDGIGDMNDLDSNMMSFTKNIVGAGNLLDLRVTVAVNAGGEDVAFDEFKIKGSLSTTYNPTINSFTPSDGSTDVSISTDLTMTLDTMVQAGAGMIHLMNITDNTSMDIAANSGDVSYSGKMVTVSNLTLDYSSDYTVLVDSNAFELSTGEVSSGIYDNTRWNFSTAAKVDTVSRLTTSFEDCGPDWKMISVVGAKEWRCSIYGNGDSSAMYMNGYSGGPQANVDYLISPPILNDPGVTFIEYYEKRRFSGNNTIRVAWSEDYDGGANPENFTWTDLYTNTGSLDTNWTSSHLLFTPLSSGQYGYFAFIYESDTTNSGVYEWTIDDVEIDIATSIKDVENTLNASVRANPITNGSIVLDLNLSDASEVEAAVYNTLGQKVLAENFSVPAVETSHSLDVSTLSEGMYILYLHSEQGTAGYKVLIQK